MKDLDEHVTHNSEAARAEFVQRVFLRMPVGIARKLSEIRCRNMSADERRVVVLDAAV